MDITIRERPEIKVCIHCGCVNNNRKSPFCSPGCKKKCNDIKDGKAVEKNYCFCGNEILNDDEFCSQECESKFNYIVKSGDILNVHIGIDSKLVIQTKKYDKIKELIYKFRNHRSNSIIRSGDEGIYSSMAEADYFNMFRNINTI